MTTFKRFAIAAIAAATILAATPATSQDTSTMIKIPGFTEHQTDVGGIAARINSGNKEEQLYAALYMVKFYGYRKEAGRQDEWRGFSQFVLNHGGDCEDWALAVRSILLGMGWATEDLALVAGDTTAGPHAVLAINVDGELRAYDQRIMQIVPWKVLSDFAPFAIYDTTTTRALTPTPTKVAGK